MANKILLGRGAKTKIESIKAQLLPYEIVYSSDTKEIAIKNSDGSITYIGKTEKLEWANILNKPNFKTVATSGKYTDLTGLPNLSLKADTVFKNYPNQDKPALNDLILINRNDVIQSTSLGKIFSNLDTDIFIIVDNRPTTGVPNKIYLVPHTKGGTNNTYEEWIWVANSSGVYGWENLGSFTIDLSGYARLSEVYTRSVVDTKVNAKMDTTTANTELNKKFDKTGGTITDDVRVEGSIDAEQVGADIISTENIQSDTGLIKMEADAVEINGYDEIRVTSGGKLSLKSTRPMDLRSDNIIALISQTDVDLTADGGNIGLGALGKVDILADEGPIILTTKDVELKNVTRFVGVPTPTVPTGAVPKSYVDNKTIDGGNL